MVNQNKLQARCWKIRLKDGMYDEVKAWFEDHNNNNEVIDLLKRDGILVQSFFIERFEKKDYLYMFIKSEQTKILEMLMNEKHHLDSEARKFILKTCEITSLKALRLISDHHNPDILAEDAR